MHLNNRGFSMVEVLIAAGLMVLLMGSFATTLTQNSRTQTEYLARIDALAFRSKISDFLDPVNCARFLNATVQTIDPNLGSMSSVNLYNYDASTGASTLFLNGSSGGGPAGGGGAPQYFGNHWRIDSIRIQPLGMGSSTTYKQIVRHANLIVTRSRRLPSNYNPTGPLAIPVTDFFAVTLTLQDSVPATIMNCFRSDQPNDGYETIPLCNPGQKLVFSSVDNQSPQWNCQLL